MAMNRKTRIKDLNQRITFVQRTETAHDSEDYPTYQFTDVFTTWAKADSGGTEEAEDNKAMFDRSEVVYTIRFRLSPVISNDMYIRHLGLMYEIISIDPVDFGREYIRITAKRTVLQ